MRMRKDVKLSPLKKRGTLPAPKKVREKPLWQRQVLLNHQKDYYRAVGDPRADDLVFLMTVISRMSENSQKRVLDRYRRKSRRRLFN